MLRSIKNRIHQLIALWANFYYGFPSKKVYIIGVTGTNGKTTVVQLIDAILNEAGYKTGMCSTIDFKIGNKRRKNKTKFTTRNSIAHQNFIWQCVQNKCDFVILETSSHSLDQNRVWGTDYDLCVITNVTREHLDYHHNLIEYRKAKLKLFQLMKNKSKKLGKKAGFSIINLDMKNPTEFFVKEKSKIYGYTLNDNYSFNKIHCLGAKHLVIGLNKNEGSTFEVNGDKFKLNLPGKFNLENAMAALTTARALGINNKYVKKVFLKVKNIPGRMEYIPNKLGLNIIIDYALTPDSMEKIGQLLKNKQLTWVFGACGERDRGKRPIMGKIVAKYASKLIITNEDPYHEDPMQIINEIAKGVFRTNKKIGKNAFIVIDRKEAIKKAIKEAKIGETILITGKGAEENMKIGDKLIPWNDRQVVEKILSN